MNCYYELLTLLQIINFWPWTPCTKSPGMNQVPSPYRQSCGVHGLSQQGWPGLPQNQQTIDSQQSFTLHYPTNYPDYQDDNFFVEALCSLQLWCNALNEFLLQLDFSCQVSRGTILSKGTCSARTGRGGRVRWRMVLEIVKMKEKKFKMMISWMIS